MNPIWTCISSPGRKDNKLSEGQTVAVCFVRAFSDSPLLATVSQNWQIRNIMSAVFNHGIRHEWITFNPISKVRCSAKRLREPDVLTPEEFQSLLTELEVRERAMVLLAGSTGLRRSELFALRWSDVNWITLEVSITRSCVRNHFGDVKTEASGKPVPLPDFVKDALIEWRTESKFGGDGDFLFPSLRLNGKLPPFADRVVGDHHPPCFGAS